MKKHYFLVWSTSEILAWVSLGLRSGPKPKTNTQRDPDSELNCIHFGIQINKCLKFLVLKFFSSKNF